MFLIQPAYAQAAAQPSAAGGAFNLILMFAIFGVMWFLMIRPQQKRAKEHRAMIEALKRGDEVLTNGGLMGRIVALGDFAVDIEIAKGTVVRMQRPFIAQVLPKGSLKGELSSSVAVNDESVAVAAEESSDNNDKPQA